MDREGILYHDVSHVPTLNSLNEVNRMVLTMLLGRLKSLLICWFTYTMKAASIACSTTGNAIPVGVSWCLDDNQGSDVLP
jgi:hypothetical protein